MSDESITVDPPVMSFPAILRNPGLNGRFAHLLDNSERMKYRERPAPSASKEKEGKRRVRRRENAKFTSNPHIVLPSSKDFNIAAQPPQSTFPEPLPGYISRSAQAPSYTPPMPDPISSRAGQFTLALKGVRKELRRSGYRAQQLVKEVESEILAWLESGSVVLFHSSGAPSGIPLSSLNPFGPIREVERSPSQLVWAIQDDAFARYIVHCVSRWHSIVSFSKSSEGDSSRLTYLLRPNASRTGELGFSSLETPPPTDFDSASSIMFDSHDSDFASDRDFPSEDEDMGGSPASATLPLSQTEGHANSYDGDPTFVLVSSQQSSPETSLSSLPTALQDLTIAEEPISSPLIQPLSHADADAGTDVDVDPDVTPRPTARISQRDKSFGVIRSVRSGSSPSRSPSARWRRQLPSIRLANAAAATGGSGVGFLPIRTARKQTAKVRPATFWAYLYE